jgi:hypothetical protein
MTVRWMMLDRTQRRAATGALEAYSGALGAETCRQRGVAGVVKQFTADAVALLEWPRDKREFLDSHFTAAPSTKVRRCNFTR